MKTNIFSWVICSFLCLLLFGCQKEEQTLFSSTEARLTDKTSESVVKETLLPALPHFLQKLGESQETAQSFSIEDSKVISSEGYKYLLISYSTSKGEFGEILVKYIDPSNVKETSLTLKNGQTIFLTTDLRVYRCYGNCACKISVKGSEVSCGCQTQVGGCELQISD